MNSLKDTCATCGRSGEIGKDLVITGDGQTVHIGRCHDQLVEQSRVRPTT